MDLSAEAAGAILTETGLEVDGIEKIESVQGGLAGVVVGEVLTCEKHPDADKLKVTTVSIGVGEPLQIVCGAPNVAAGQKVIVATVGCTLYPKPDEAFKIKSSKIRGVDSQGMLCAEDELGLGASHDGILVLPPETQVGIPAASYFELEDDYQIEIGLTPNRADAMGHIGVARDLLAHINLHQNKTQKLNWPEIKLLQVNDTSLPVSINIEEPELCPRYVGVSLKNVKIQASPAWLQKKLRAVGLSPINNVVDCTNFVMRELGTPLHAFDYAQTKGGIAVKRAKSGDKFVTLDGVERVLDADNLMITNGNDYLAIAGVFGGLKSGISEQTTEILVESAYFNPVSVRKTAKFHGLSTDASFRYERGVDPHLTVLALERVVNLIQEVAGGELASEIQDVNPKPITNVKIDFRPAFANKLIGASISDGEIQTILELLDIQVLEKQEYNWTLEIPAYRVDVTREVDVVEEILRIYGFNRVELPAKLNTNLQQYSKPDKEKVQQVISSLLVANGFYEIMNNSLTASAYSEKLASHFVDSRVEILNPLSQDLGVLRQTLLFGALESVAHNQNRQQADVKLFEFGNTYFKDGDKHRENKRLMLTISGDLLEEQWNSSKGKSNFYTLKGIVFALLSRLGLSAMLQEKALESALLADGEDLFVLKTNIGTMGWVSAGIRKHFGIKNEVFIADLDWDALIDCLKFNKTQFSEIPKTFEMRRDYSLLLDQAIKYAEIEQLAKKIDNKVLKRMRLFDVYEGEKLEANKKSYAVAFYFQDGEQTLKDQVVDAIMQKIRVELEQKLGAQLR